MGLLTTWSGGVSSEQLASPGWSPRASLTAPLASPDVALLRRVSPLQEHHMIGSFEACLVLFKATVGPGVLFLPAAVKNAGLLSAVLVSTICGIAATWCMLLLVDIVRMLRDRGMLVAEFGDIGQAAYGAFGRFAVDASIVVSQLGICTAYCVFIAENLQALVFEAYGGLPASAGQGEPCQLPEVFATKGLVYYFILVLIPLLIPATWVRQLRYFACTNLIASALVVGSLLFMLASCAWNLFTGVPTAGQVRWFVPYGTLVYCGTAMYAFEGVGVLLPTARSMAQPENLKIVVICTMSLICLLQVVFAAAFYWIYRENTHSIITISLSDGSTLGGMGGVKLVQLTWVLEVLLTFPLQLFPAARLLEPACFSRGSYRRRHSGHKWRKNFARAGLVLLCMGVSTVGYTSVDNLVALIGAVGCVPLALVYPPLFHRRIAFGPSSCAKEDNKTDQLPAGGPISDLAIGLLGALGTVLAAVLSLVSWTRSSFDFSICILRHD